MYEVVNKQAGPINSLRFTWKGGGVVGGSNTLLLYL